MWMSLSPLNIEKIWNPFLSHRIRLLQASIHYRIDTFNVMWSPSTQTLDSTFKAHWHGQDLLKSPIFAHKNPQREHYSTFSCFLRGCFVGCGFRWLGTRSSVLVENVKNCKKRWASWKWWNFCRFNPQLLGLIHPSKINIGVSKKRATPKITPQVMIIFSRKTPWVCWVPSF